MLIIRPSYFQELLAGHGLEDLMYENIRNEDLTQLVMSTLNIIKTHKVVAPLEKFAKCEKRSNKLRSEGNMAFHTDRLQKSLIFYNKALKFAPANSRALKLAYSNRSALLQKVNLFTACLEDIKTCFSLGCPDDIKQKLMMRKEVVEHFIRAEEAFRDSRRTPFSDRYFDFTSRHNPQIPSASTDVGVMLMESQTPTIVARKDVKVGTVLAVESAFVTHVDRANLSTSCYFCNKLHLNLIPCDGCCYALFCNEACKQMCMNEYHRVECQIIEYLEEILSCTTHIKHRLALKAALKMYQMSHNWKDFIRESLIYGEERIKNSSIKDIYYTHSKNSLLCSNKDQHFFQGPLFNATVVNASILFHLETVPDFFPTAKAEKDAALEAVGRVLMILTMYSTTTLNSQPITVKVDNKSAFQDFPNFGFYPFIGKLKHSCIPNMIAISVNKKMALVAVQPIKRGTELTYSHVGHWQENPVDRFLRRKTMSQICNLVCNCMICSSEYLRLNSSLTGLQKSTFEDLDVENLMKTKNLKLIPMIYEKLAMALAVLNDIPHSEEYRLVYSLFRRCIAYLQDMACQNIILEYEINYGPWGFFRNLIKEDKYSTRVFARFNI